MNHNPHDLRLCQGISTKVTCTERGALEREISRLHQELEALHKELEAHKMALTAANTRIELADARIESLRGNMWRITHNEDCKECQESSKIISQAYSIDDGINNE